MSFFRCAVCACIVSNSVKCIDCELTYCSIGCERWHMGSGHLCEAEEKNVVAINTRLRSPMSLQNIVNIKQILEAGQYDGTTLTSTQMKYWSGVIAELEEYAPLIEIINDVFKQ